MIRARFVSARTQVEFRFRPRGQSDQHERTAASERGEVFLKISSAHEVEDYVRSYAVRELRDLRPNSGGLPTAMPRSSPNSRQVSIFAAVRDVPMTLQPNAFAI